MRITVPKPCEEDWAAMTPTDRGRHCAACEKVVVDFTRMSDGEIARWFAEKAGERVCGRFEKGQVGRELRLEPLPVIRRSWSWARVAAAVGALWVVLNGNETYAQKVNLVEQISLPTLNPDDFKLMEVFPNQELIPTKSVIPSTESVTRYIIGGSVEGVEIQRGTEPGGKIFNTGANFEWYMFLKFPNDPPAPGVMPGMLHTHW